MTKINFSLAVTVLVAAIFAVTGHAEYTFPVYRLYQYDRLDSKNYTQVGRFGARRTGCEGTPIDWHTIASNSNSNSNSTLHRKIVVVDSTDAAHPLDADVIPTIVALLNKRGASGLLLLVPKSGRFSSPELAANWARAEQQLVLGGEISCAAYIAFKEDAARISPKLSLTVKERRGLLVASENPTIRTAVSTLSGAAAKDSENAGLALPTVAVIAHYDTFAAAPALGVAADASASGVSVVLELLRTFSHLYSTKSSTPAYNLAFVLAGGAPLNWAGLRHWAEHVPIETPVEFALCLDTVTLSGSSSAETFYLHVSKPPKDAAIRRFYDAFGNAAKALGLPKLEVIHKKVNVAKPEADWPHEALAMKRILGATLSRLPAAPAAESLLARTSVLDRRAADPAQVARAAQLVGEALARILYPSVAESSGKALAETFAPSEKRLGEWTAALAGTPRTTPAATTDGAPVFESMLHAMKASCVNTEVDSLTYVTSKKGARKQAAAAAAAAAAKKRNAGTAKKVSEEDEDDEITMGNDDSVIRFFVTPVGYKNQDLQMTVHRRAPLLWNLYVLLITLGFLAASSAFIHTMGTKSKSD